MRHKLSGRKLNRTSSHRAAMFKNLCISAIEHELIKTTLPKGKDLRRVLEPLITLAKNDSVANRRLAYARIGNDAAVKKLFEVLGPRYKTRQGGYLRVLKCGFRVGDSAPMCFIELVDRDNAPQAEAAPAAKPKAKAKAKPKAEAETVAAEVVTTEEAAPAKPKAKAKPKAAAAEGEAAPKPKKPRAKKEDAE